jgi:hypothetical protein
MTGIVAVSHCCQHGFAKVKGSTNTPRARESRSMSTTKAGNILLCSEEYDWLLWDSTTRWGSDSGTVSAVYKADGGGGECHCDWPASIACMRAFAKAKRSSGTTTRPLPQPTPCHASGSMTMTVVTTTTFCVAEISSATTSLLHRLRAPN